jgi:hypothetical protein
MFFWFDRPGILTWMSTCEHQDGQRPTPIAETPRLAQQTPVERNNRADVLPVDLLPDRHIHKAATTRDHYQLHWTGRMLVS